MLRLDLRHSDGSLHPLAHWRIIAYMTYPGNRAQRHRFIKLGEELYRAPDEQQAQRAFAQIRPAFLEGAVAGDLLLYLLQLHEHHRLASLNRALRLVRAAILHHADRPLRGLPPAEELTGREWHAARKALGLRAIHRPTLLKIFWRFRPVAHLWAAFLLAEYLDRPNLDFLRAPANIPRLAALSHALARRAAKVPLWSKQRERVLPPRLACKVFVPDAHP